MSEPWLSGSLKDLHPSLAAVVYSFQQVREELAGWTDGMTPEQLWSKPHGLTSVGWHLTHLAGAADRLFTYAEGQQLSEQQMAAMKAEAEAGGSTRDQVLERMNATLDGIAARVKAIDPATLTSFRGVGRKQMPTSVAGLLVHIAEHTQRHAGQAIVSCKLVRAMAGG